MEIPVFTAVGDAELRMVTLATAKRMIEAGEARWKFHKRKPVGVRLIPPQWWTPRSAGMPMFGACLNRASGAVRPQ